MRRVKRDAWVSSRTVQSVKDAVRAEALGQHRSDSEVVHLVLCRHYVVDPTTGKMLTGDTEATAPGHGQELEV